MHTRMQTHMHTRTSTLHARAHTHPRARTHTQDTIRDVIPLYWYKRFFMSDFMDTLLTFVFLFLLHTWPLCMRVLSLFPQALFLIITHMHSFSTNLPPLLDLDQREEVDEIAR
jgi:hypothetical protein